jgi:DNA-directed RNA polymerase subunit M
MLFCPKCRSIMLPKKENGRAVLVCSCGHRAEVSGLKLSEPARKQEARGAGAVEKEIEVNAKIEAECQKCKNNEAFTWEIQTRAGDEPPTKFFRCTKCRHTWRDYK